MIINRLAHQHRNEYPILSPGEVQLRINNTDQIHMLFGLDHPEPPTINRIPSGYYWWVVLLLRITKRPRETSEQTDFY